VLALALAIGCAVPRVSLPTGSIGPAPDGASVWDEATRACRGVRTLSADLTVWGSADNHRLPHLHVLTGLTADGSILLDVPNYFVLAGNTDQASLLLRTERSLVRAPAGEIVQVLLGVPIEPRQWLALLTGCVTPTAAFRSARRIGPYTEIEVDGAQVFLESRAGRPQPAFANAYGVAVNYRTFLGDWPREWRASTPPGRSPEASFAVQAANILIDQPIDPSAFAIRGADQATPMTLEQLRARLRGQ
jgi:hypothetical protein